MQSPFFYAGFTVASPELCYTLIENAGLHMRKDEKPGAAIFVKSDESGYEEREMRKSINCPRCGKINAGTNMQCTYCGAALSSAQARQAKNLKEKTVSWLVVILFLIPIIGSLSAVGQGFIRYKTAQNELQNAHETTGIITDTGTMDMQIKYEQDTDGETYRIVEFSQIDYITIDEGHGDTQSITVKEVVSDDDDLHKTGDTVPIYYNGSIWQLGTIAEQDNGAVSEMVIGAILAAFFTWMLILFK